MQSYQVHTCYNGWLAKIRLQHLNKQQRWERESNKEGCQPCPCSLECQCPSQTEQTLSAHVGHASITGQKRVESNQMIKLKSTPVTFIVFHPFVKNNFWFVVWCFHGTQRNSAPCIHDSSIMQVYDCLLWHVQACLSLLHIQPLSVISAATEGEPSLASGCLNTASFTTLLDLASPSQYDRMSMVFLNENSNRVLKGDQREAECSHLWGFFRGLHLLTPVGLLLITDLCPRTHAHHNIIHNSRMSHHANLLPCLQSLHLSSKGPSRD